jgi:signal peptidase
VIIIGGVVAFWFGLQAGLGTQYPLLTVASGSMIPTLNVGDLIAVQGIANYSTVGAGLWKSPNEGDIIVFHRPPQYGPDELIVHRAISKTLGDDGLWYFRTQGDNNGVPDSWTVSQSLIVGKVVGKVPYLGYIPLTIRKPEGILLIVLLMVIIILAEYIPSSGKKQEQQT